MQNNTNGHRRLMLAAGVGAAVAGAAAILHRDRTASLHPQGLAMPIDIEGLAEGVLRIVEWEGRPVWVLRRTVAQVAALAGHEALLADPESKQSLQAPACRNRHRSLRPDIFVAIGLCTHEGCTPALRGDIGFLCPCHASRFDFAGRVFKGGPATTNLVIPAYRFEGSGRLVVGVDA
jgi:ubiquinol-cytochrome c reductase iron-sulfur subunit